MPAATFTAKQVARLVATKTGRPCDAKRIRAWVRDNVTAFDDDGYTAHVYDSRTRDKIVAAFVARASGKTPGTPARSRAASEGRGTRTAAKPAAPADRKRTSKPPVPPMSGDAPAN